MCLLAKNIVVATAKAATSTTVAMIGVGDAGATKSVLSLRPEWKKGSSGD